MHLSAVGLLILAFCSFSYARNKYMITANKQVVRGSDYILSVRIKDVSERVHITAAIIVNRAEVSGAVASGSYDSSDNPKELVLPIPSTLNQWGVSLVVNATGGLTFSETRSLTVSGSSTSVLIQTDKAIYKPSDLVRLRFVGINQDLIPQPGPYNMSIIDSQRNVLAQVKNKELGNNEGYISDEILLSEEPPMGDWSIKVELNGVEETKTFTVGEYELPKYEVKMNFDRPFHVLEFGDIRGNVQAKYTFGQPVESTCVITIKKNDNYMYYDDFMGDAIRRRPEERPGRPGPMLITRTIQPSETGRFEFSITLNELHDISGVSSLEQIVGHTFTIEAKVSETLTGKSFDLSQEIEIKSQRLNIKFLENTPTSYKRGMPFTAYIKLTQADDSDVSQNELVDSQGSPKTIIIEQTYESSNDRGVAMRESETLETRFDLGSNGIVVANLNIPSNATSVHLTAKYKYENGQKEIRSERKTINEYKSRDGGSIQLSMQGSEQILRGDETRTFDIRSTVPLSAANYYVVIKEKVVKSGKLFTSGNERTTVSFDIDFDATVAMSAKIAVLAISNNGEVLVDATVLNVESQMPNNVEVEFSHSEREPGESVELNIRAEPDSFIGILAVDRSVQLLKSGNDITHDLLIEKIGNSNSNNGGGGGPIMFDIMPRCFRCWWPYYPGGSDAQTALNNLGLIAITDSYIHQEEPDIDYRYRVDMMEGVPGPPMVEDNEKSGNDVEERETLQEPARVRKNFEEVWIWVDENVGSTGNIQIPASVPDTMTSWSANVLAVNRHKGVGVPLNPAMLTVFQPFFAQLDLPYSIVKGEMFELMVNIFNYEQNTQEITVTLQDSANFDVSGSSVKNIQIASGVAGQVKFMIRPSVLGQVDIEVRAQSALSADALIRQILVEPEGFPESRTMTTLVDLSGEARSFLKDFDIEYPSTFVPGSQYLEVSVMGDVMTKMVKNLGSLIQMPYGCGEQNMINFVPNILVMEYFKHTGLGNTEQRGNALNYMKKGYQRELTYQHTDGAFSAFGNNDPEGSTWLTAFVVRSFNRARSHIFIDEAKLKMAVQWLLTKHNNGQFREDGTVLHGELKGNSYRNAALTAYVLETLCRVRDMQLDSEFDIERVITQASNYLKNRGFETGDDDYSLAIVTSAFQCLGDSYADTLLNELNRRADEEDSGKYWAEPVSLEPEMPVRHYGHYGHPAMEVEQTAYGLLANLYADKPLGEIIPILSWLTKQQNSQGGFRSTQDTVLALTGFAEYAKRAYNGNSGNGVNVDVQIIAKEEGSTANLVSYDFETVTKDNGLVLQQFQLPDNTEIVEMTARGSGIATVQVAIKYHVFVNETSEDIFLRVNSSVVNNNPRYISIDACTRWLASDTSGMGNIDFAPVSGYSFVTDDVAKAHPLMKRFEVIDERLNTYWNEFPQGEDVCVHLQMEKQYEVEDVQPAHAESFAYYSPNRRSVANYLPMSMRNDDTLVVDMCTKCPKCCEPVRNIDTTEPTRVTDGCNTVVASWMMVFAILSLIFVL